MLEIKHQQRPLGYRRPVLLSEILFLLIVATQSTTTSAFAPPTLQRNGMRNHDTMNHDTMRVKNRRRLYSLSYMSKEDDSNSKQEDDRSNTEDNTPKQTTISGEYDFVHKMCMYIIIDAYHFHSNI